MSRTSTLPALALLVVVAAVTVGTVSGVVTDGGSVVPGQVEGEPSEVTPVSNTTNYLTIGSLDRQNYTSNDVDVTAAAGMSAERLHARHDNQVFDRQFDAAAGSQPERLSLVRERADSVEARLDRLDARHDAIIDRYGNNSIPRETFLRRVARLSVSAEMSSEHLQHVANRVDVSPGTTLPVSLDTRLSNLQTDLITLPNPVGERIQSGLAGERDPGVVYTGGTADRLVLAMVDRGEFVRTATLRDEFAPDEPDQFEDSEGRALSLAYERGSELYGWAYDNAVRTPQLGGLGSTTVYRISVDYPHGTLETYLSGGTANAFHEIQVQRPDGVPVTDTVTRENNSLEVTVETTTETGPMRVSLIQPSSGAPLNGTVVIDGEVVGETGDDGQLYTVHPAGPFRVNATTEANSVEVFVS